MRKLFVVERQMSDDSYMPLLNTVSKDHAAAVWKKLHLLEKSSGVVYRVAKYELVGAA